MFTENDLIIAYYEGRKFASKAVYPKSDMDGTLGALGGGAGGALVGAPLGAGAGATAGALGALATGPLAPVTGLVTVPAGAAIGTGLGALAGGTAGALLGKKVGENVHLLR